MAIVYYHRRKDTNEVFYVGIGKSQKRAYETYSRSAFWKRVVEKWDYVVDIVLKDLTWEEAVEQEKRLIKEIGRRDLGEGSLVNMTDGGEGTINISPAARAKASQLRKGKPGNMLGKKHTEVVRAKMSERRKGNTNAKGSKRTKESVERMSASRKGKPGTFSGKTHKEESKQKVKNAWTPERKEKARSANTGKKLSEESIRKRQESRQKNQLRKAYEQDTNRTLR